MIIKLTKLSVFFFFGVQSALYNINNNSNGVTFAVVEVVVVAVVVTF